MAAPIPGFPKRFPVRTDGRRPRRYRVVSWFCRAVFRTLFGSRLRFEGGESIPAAGPLVVAANHLSNWDPFLFGGFFPGALFALAKREIYKPAPVAWTLAGCNCIPVDRKGADRRAVRMALDVLMAKRRLLIFVEGTRSRRPGMGPAEAGAGFLVRRSGAQVLPVALWGTESALRLRPWPRRGRITVRYGEPFRVTAEGDREIAAEIAARIAALLPPEYRGVHAEAAALIGTAP